MLTPRDEAELAEVIRSARGPLSVGGGFTRGLARKGERLSTAAMSGIVLHEPGALTLVARAGTRGGSGAGPTAGSTVARVSL